MNLPTIFASPLSEVKAEQRGRYAFTCSPNTVCVCACVRMCVRARARVSLSLSHTLCARPWCVRVRVYLCVRIQFRGLLRGDSGVTRAGNEVTGEVSNALNTKDGLLTGETTWPGNFSQCVIKLCAVPRLGSVGGGGGARKQAQLHQSDGRTIVPASVGLHDGRLRKKINKK